MGEFQVGTQTLITIGAVLTVVLAGVVTWLGYQLYVAHLLLRSFHRLLRPQVERDGQGRPLKERL